MSETQTPASAREGAGAGGADRILSGSFPGANEAQLDAMLAYLATLDKWSRLHNLTGADSPGERLELLCDCAPLVERASGTRGPICDVGSGAGMPGVPLAVMHPGRRVALVESEASKAAFLEQARIEAGLGNVEVVHKRVEDWRPDEPPGLVCVRGLASLADTALACSALLDGGATLLSLKPRDPTEDIGELLAARPGWRAGAEPVETPGPSRFLVEAGAGS